RTIRRVASRSSRRCERAWLSRCAGQWHTTGSGQHGGSVGYLGGSQKYDKEPRGRESHGPGHGRCEGRGPMMPRMTNTAFRWVLALSVGALAATSLAGCVGEVNGGGDGGNGGNGGDGAASSQGGGGG